MASLLIFDDTDRTGAIAPLGDLRPIFAVRTGAMTTLERLVAVLDAMGGWELDGVWVPGAIEALTAERSPAPVNPDEKGLSEGVLVVNGRCVVPPANLAGLGVGEAFVEGEDRTLVAAHLLREDAIHAARTGELPSDTSVALVPDPVLMRRPWDVIRFRDEAIEVDLAILAATAGPEARLEGVVVLEGGSGRLVVGEGATVTPSAVIDVTKGHVVIGDGATIGARAVVQGPCYIGEGATVLEGALIRGNTAIGPVCKVAGEVSGSIFQGFSNKGHDGYLGDSWLGEWVNLGAGTVGSNLLNTYGPVMMSAAGGRPERTGLQFLGAVIGDHTKTAIGTRMMTGSHYSTGSMIAMSGFAPSFTERFAWLTDERHQRYRLEKFLDVMSTVMARRGIEAGEAYRDRLGALFAGSEGV